MSIIPRISVPRRRVPSFSVRALSGLAPALLLAVLAAGCGDGSPVAPLQGGKESASEAPHGPRPLEEPEPTWVRRQLIVRPSSRATIEEINAAFGTSTIAEIPGARTYLVETPEHVPVEAMALGMMSSVLCDHAEPNYDLQTPESEQLSLAIYEGEYGHDDYVDQGAMGRIRAAEAHATATGAGILVAVIDTGIDLDHPDLTDNLGPPGYDFIDEDGDPSDLPNYLDDDGNGMVDEAVGHGTHVAGIIALAAPEVLVLPLRVLGSDGTGTAFNVTRAIHHAVDTGVQVINLSLGLDVRVDSMKRAIQRARGEGILVVASAGNRGIRDPDHFPAGLSDVMAVAATDELDLKAPFSSYGGHISVSAPGRGIMSTYWNGGYAIWSGTSMAAPFVTGAAALRLEVEPEDPDSIQQRIEDSSADLPDGPYEGEIGEGRIDLFALVAKGD